MASQQWSVDLGVGFGLHTSPADPAPDTKDSLLVGRLGWIDRTSIEMLAWQRTRAGLAPTGLADAQRGESGSGFGVSRPNRLASSASATMTKGPSPKSSHCLVRIANRKFRERPSIKVDESFLGGCRDGCYLSFRSDLETCKAAECSVTFCLRPISPQHSTQ